MRADTPAAADGGTAGQLLFSRAHHYILETYGNTRSVPVLLKHSSVLSPGATACGKRDLSGESGYKKEKQYS